MARTPLARPGCLVTSLTRSPRSQTSRSFACRPLMYSAPVRAAIATVLAPGCISAPRPAGPQPRDGLRRAHLEKLLELQILAGRGVRVALDQSRAWGLDARAHAPDEPLLEDRGHQHLVGDDLLDLVQLRLPLLAVELLLLTLEQVVDLGQRA